MTSEVDIGEGDNSTHILRTPQLRMKRSGLGGERFSEVRGPTPRTCLLALSVGRRHRQQDATHLRCTKDSYPPCAVQHFEQLEVIRDESHMLRLCQLCRTQYLEGAVGVEDGSQLRRRLPRRLRSLGPGDTAPTQRSQN